MKTKERSGRGRAGLWRWLGASPLLLALGTLSGCGGPGVDDVCDTLDKHECATWSGKAECVSDGKALEARVDSKGGCDDSFDEYLACLHDATGCDWGGLCATERSAVEACIGAF